MFFLESLNQLQASKKHKIYFGGENCKKKLGNKWNMRNQTVANVNHTLFVIFLVLNSSALRQAS